MQKNIIICIKDIHRINHFIIWKYIWLKSLGEVLFFGDFSKVLVGFDLLFLKI